MLPSIGTMVYWYPEGDLNMLPRAAFVTKHGVNSLDLHVIEPSFKNFLVKFGVPHVSASREQKINMRDTGLWDYMEQSPQSSTQAAVKIDKVKAHA